MTMAHKPSGRFAMTTDRGVWLLAPWLLAAAPVLCADPLPPPPQDAQAAHQILLDEGLRQRLLGDDGLTVRRLDPAIFLEVSPVTATEPAIRLPNDQQDAD
jgi:hypothetical protein